MALCLSMELNVAGPPDNRIPSGRVAALSVTSAGSVEQNNRVSIWYKFRA